jgi:hypothetical protein
MANLSAIFRGKFYNRPKSIAAANGSITFTDADDKEFKIGVTRWGRTAKASQAAQALPRSLLRKLLARCSNYRA